MTDVPTENKNIISQPATEETICTLEQLKGKAPAGRLLGVDFGDTRTGLALSDINRFLASGIGYISPGGLQRTAEAVVTTAKEKNVTGVIVGFPINMNGSLGPRSARVKEFAEVVATLSGLPVSLVDERLSTMEAARFLNETNTRGIKRKKTIDTLSAQIILQDALDRIKNITPN